MYWCTQAHGLRAGGKLEADHTVREPLSVLLPYSLEGAAANHGNGHMRRQLSVPWVAKKRH